MKFLNDIKEHLEKQFSVKILGKASKNAEIKAIGFLPKDFKKESLLENVFYIGNSTDELTEDLEESLSLKQSVVLFFTEESGKDKNNIFYTDKILDKKEVYNSLKDYLLREKELQEKEKELFSALYESKGTDELARIAHCFLKNPISVCDTSFSILTSYPVVKDTKNLDSKNGKQFLRNAPFQDMFDRHIIDHLYNSEKALVTDIEGYNFKWMFKSIKIKSKVAGYICLRGTIRDFIEEDFKFLDTFSKIFSIEMQKDTTFLQPTGSRYEYFFTELLEGQTDRADSIIEHLYDLAGKRLPYFTIAIIQPDSVRKNKPQQLKDYFSQLQTILPGCMIVSFHGNLTLLLPSETLDPFSIFNKDRLISFLRLNHMNAFLSYPFLDLKDLHIYYEQAKGLSFLKGQKSQRESTPIFYFKNNFLEHTFRQTENKNLLIASIHPEILQLLEHDNKYETEFISTLKAYIKHNRNAADAAKDLHIHKSTFFYRIGKMEDLFGVSIKDPEKLFAYEYSFRLLDYL